MKIQIILATTCLLLSTSTIADNRLIGKTYSLKWSIQSVSGESPADSTKLAFCNGLRLVWNTILDDKTVSAGVENYELTEVEPGILQVTWRQRADRTEFVVATLNLFKWSVYGVTISSDEARFSAGSFAVEDGVGADRISGRCA